MRKPDAWCMLKENEDIMVLVRSKERAEVQPPARKRDET